MEDGDEEPERSTLMVIGRETVRKGAPLEDRAGGAEAMEGESVDCVDVVSTLRPESRRRRFGEGIEEEEPAAEAEIGEAPIGRAVVEVGVQSVSAKRQTNVVGVKKVLMDREGGGAVFAIVSITDEEMGC